MAANSILKLRVDSSEYDAKLKKAAEGLQHLAKSAHDSGGELINLEKDEVAFIREMGSMNTSAKTAAGSIREMESTLKAMTLTYKQMSDVEKSGNAGKALSDAMAELKSRLIPAKQALAETEKEMRKLNQEVSASQNPFGQYGSIIDNIGSRFGITGNLTELLTSKTAMMTAGIGSSIAIVTKATEAWAGYNAELAKQDQQTRVITGLKGDDAEKMTDSIRAMVDTYDVDFRQAVEAANTLMSQFGETGEDAMMILRDGMQGMLQGDGGKLLQMIQQYAPAFRDAGVSARQLVAVIQNSEGGIFTDQNMNAIVMGIKNIRLMTKATSDALKQMGIDGDQMSQQLSNGTLTVFDALKQVAGTIQTVDSNSKVAGEVMQQVFGRQGAMAGTNLGKAIAQLNTNLEETKRQTGEIGEAYAELQTANERLNKAIRDCFEYDGWEQMAKGIKVELIDALSSVLELSANIKGVWTSVTDIPLFGAIADGISSVMNPLGNLLSILEKIRVLSKSGVKTGGNWQPIGENIDDNGNFIKRPQNGNYAHFNTSTGQYEQGYGPNGKKLVSKPGEAVQYGSATVTRKGSGGGGGGGNTPTPTVEKTEEQLNSESIAKLTKEYQKLAQASSTASAEQQAGFTKRMSDIQEEIAALQKRNDQLRQWADEAKGGSNEIQRNDERIKSLTDDYKKVSDIAKTATGDELKNAQARQQAIRTEIDGLQKRNEQLRLYEQQARGEAPEVGSKKQLQRQLGDLQQRQSLIAPDTQGWRDLQKEIDATARQLDIVQGKIPKGEQAVITFTVKKDELDKTMANLPKDKNVKVNIETVEPKPFDVKVNKPEPVDIKVNEPEPVEVKTIAPKPVDVKVNKPEPVDIKVNDPEPVEVKVYVESVGDIDDLTDEDRTVHYNVETDVADLTDEDRTVHYNVETDGADLTDLTDETVTVSVAVTGQDSLEALKKQLDTELGDRKYTITYETKTVDTKAFNTQNIDAFLADAKNKIKEAEIGSELYNQLTARIADTSALSNMIQVAIKNGFDMSSLGGMDVNIWKQLLANQDVPTEELQAMIDKINAWFEEKGIKLKFGLDANTGEVKEEKKSKSNDDTITKASKALSGLSSIKGGLDQIGIKLPSEIEKAIAVMQGVMAVIQGVNTIISIFSTSTAAAQIISVNANTAALIANTTALAINSATNFIPFRNGGIVPAFKTGGIVPHAAIGYEVPGHDYSDATPVMVSSGELILNRSQQGNLASQLEQARQESYGGGGGTPYVQGELIYLGVNNFLKRSGRGEIVTTKRG